MKRMAVLTTQVSRIKDLAKHRGPTWSITTNLPQIPRKSVRSEQAAYEQARDYARQYQEGTLRRDLTTMTVWSNNGSGWTVVKTVDLTDPIWNPVP